MDKDVKLPYGFGGHDQGIIEKKIWAHWFLAKPKTTAAGGLGKAVSRQGFLGDALLKAWVGSPQTIFFFV